MEMTLNNFLVFFVHNNGISIPLRNSAVKKLKLYIYIYIYKVTIIQLPVYIVLRKVLLLRERSKIFMGG